MTTPRLANMAPPETYRLRIPGPTAVPERVRLAMARPVQAHRGAEFKAILAAAVERLAPVFGTRNRILLHSSSGTGMMEAALVNVLAAGERILVIENGQFGERFSQIAKAYGVVVDPLVVPWGEEADPADVAKRLASADYRAVVMVHNESSTGVAADLAAVGRVVAKTPALLVVDSVSGLGGMPIGQDAAGVDVLVTGSQKALMSPPGIGLASVSEKAWTVVGRDDRLPRFYFDFRKARDSAEKGDTTFTGPVSLVYALNEALAMMHEEGLERVFARHARLSRALKAGAAAIGLENFTRSRHQSTTVAVFHAPKGYDGGAIVRGMYERHRSVIAGARNRLSGKVIRIGTMGAVTDSDVLTDLAHLEDVLASLGLALEAGAGVAAAARALAAH
ncbi:MAG TPA: alanine--glyoxylate aminotransferase family protein [Hyphomicrobiaceae bacterium]|nr:alanine--glyoxylate aminotransferase family protein [Hyphomicrobiaceae bacterium]